MKNSMPFITKYWRKKSEKSEKNLYGFERTKMRRIPTVLRRQFWWVAQLCPNPQISEHGRRAFIEHIQTAFALGLHRHWVGVSVLARKGQKQWHYVFAGIDRSQSVYRLLCFVDRILNGVLQNQWIATETRVLSLEFGTQTSHALRRRAVPGRD